MGAVVALIVGLVLLVISANRARFERVWGPALRSQWSLEQRLPGWHRGTLERRVTFVRVTVIAFGFVSVVIGVAGLVTLLV